MKRQLFWGLVALLVFVGFLARTERSSAQTGAARVAPDSQSIDTVTLNPDDVDKSATSALGDINRRASILATRSPKAESSQSQPSLTTSPNSTLVAHPQHIVDFDGDGKTDFSIIRNNGLGVSSSWISLLNDGTDANVRYQNWGVSDVDQFEPADFDGDNHTDYAIWRPPVNGQHAAFWILNSLDGTVSYVEFGVEGDDPSVVRDYDGDGKADVAVYRRDATANKGTWFYSPSSGPYKGAVVGFQWGTASDSPYTGDFNGDGKADFAIDRPSDPLNLNSQSEIWIHYGDGGVNAGGATADRVDRWGVFSDLYIPGDFDGDGKTDLAIARNVGNQLEWWVRWSTDDSVHVVRWGVSSADTIAQGDYDGDGKTDIAVWRQSDRTFYILASSTGTPIYKAWGVTTGVDTPTAGYDIEYF